MNKKFYFTCINDSVTEGGMSRNKAFHDYFKAKKFKIVNISKSKLYLLPFNILYTLFIILFTKKNTLFFQQFSLFYLFTPFIYNNNSIVTILRKIFAYTAQRNRVIIEINDLVWEQALDLKLQLKPCLQPFEKFILTLPEVEYIVASYQMREFIIKEYQINPNTVSVIINGCHSFDAIMDYQIERYLPNFNNLRSSSLVLVYAGALNKGRQIELMLNQLSKLKSICVVLIGTGGEWIKHQDLNDNIMYLGAFEESVAQKIVSACDFGLIPYDETKMYYNLCYPTKASFYISSGIPFISTPLAELQYNFPDNPAAIFMPIEQWNEYIINASKFDVIELKKMALKQSSTLNWKYLFNNNLLMQSITE